MSSNDIRKVFCEHFRLNPVKKFFETIQKFLSFLQVRRHEFFQN